ncbi:hypothetical protein [Halorubrum vacuolatum]|uniref:ParB-like nuclease domain-containing protein n=1 Tax=Halorubrum vacuolatum TaxID=63740 RepID=A0A238UP70_HALVU|nr:hypothetical protein [Halorubrum vacuolatum]SNR23922.1 hypothetical protein SAMN06264855_101192 [Halorubrum vacuolatum]
MIPSIDLPQSESINKLNKYPKYEYMVSYYAKRAAEIVREEGIVAFSKQSRNFINQQFSIDQKLFKIHTFKNGLSNRVRYDSPPSPFRPIVVDPQNVEHRHYKFSTPRNGLGKVKGGNWDAEANLVPTSEDKTIAGLRQRFEEQKDWEETIYFEKFRSKYNGNEERVKERCEYVESLYEDIKNNGYRRAKDGENTRQRSGYGQKLEVLVVIDRNGKIHHQGKGSHRLAIAKILQIPVPVQVLVRHEQWQNLRDEVCNDGLPEDRKELANHADLKDVLG